MSIMKNSYTLNHVMVFFMLESHLNEHNELVIL